MYNFDITWTRYDDKFTCIVGYLTYDEIETKAWYFKYDKEGFEVAYQLGFRGFAEFPEVDQEYTSPTLFSQFSNRIQRNIRNSVTETEKVDMLENSEGGLNTDKLKITYQKRR